MTKSLSIQKTIGKGYNVFWNFKGRYRVVKGSRASKKSKTTALWFIYNMMKYKGANTLVIRKTYRTLKDSCYAELKWAIHMLGVDSFWSCKESPLEMTYLPTGQKIYFRGLDDPLKVTSITVDRGSLCWAWIEEAYEIMSESDFDMLDESIRGESEVFKQITLTFNPWNERHWLKHRFFDTKRDDTLALTTNYLCNEWLDNSDLEVFERMKTHNPRRYQVAGLGNWGIVEGLVYENWKEEYFTLGDVRNAKTVSGLDFGFNDPAALFVGFIDTEQKKLYVWDELYKTGLTNSKLYDEIVNAGYGKNRIICDCAEPKTIHDLKGYGLKAEASTKGRGSIMNGIQFIQDYEIIIHPRCTNFLTEISNYAWRKDKFGKTMDEPVDEGNHLMDAMRYAVEKYSNNRKLRTLDKSLLFSRR